MLLGKRSRLSKAERTEVNTGFRKKLAFTCYELAEATIDSYNFVEFSSQEQQNSLINKLYTAASILAIFISLYATVTNVLMLRQLMRAYALGLGNSKHLHRRDTRKAGRRSLFQRNFTAQKIVPGSTAYEKPEGQKNEPDEVNYELKLLNSKANVSHYKIMLILGILEDLPLVLILYFRIADFHYQCFSDKKGSNDVQDINNQLIQLVVCAFGLAMKLSFMRDLSREKIKQQKCEQEILLRTNSSKSILDDFTDVSEEEIRKVLVVRRLLQEDASKAFPGILSDITILQAIRFYKYETLESTKYLRDWLKWRSRHKCDQIREEIFEKSYSFSDLPSLISCIFSGAVAKQNEDIKKHKFIIYHYGGSWANLAMLDSFSDEEIVKRYIYDVEYFDILLEHLSIQRQNVVSPVILGYNGPCNANEEETLKRLKLLRELPTYPHFLTMKGFIPFNQKQHCSGWIGYIGDQSSAFQKFSDANTAYEKVCASVSEEFLPRAFKGGLQTSKYSSGIRRGIFGGIGEQYRINHRIMNRTRNRFGSEWATDPRPENMKSIHGTTCREHIEQESIESQVRKRNDTSEKDEIKEDPNQASDTIDPWGLKSYIPQSLASLTTEFSDLYLFRDTTIFDVSQVQKLRLAIIEVIGKSEYNKHPSSFLGDVSLLRILRYNKFEIEAAVVDTLEKLELRNKYKLLEIHNEIVTRDYCLHNLPYWKEYIQFRPSYGKIERDKHGNLVILTVVTDLLNFDILNIDGFNATKLGMAGMYICEYVSIMLDRLSRFDKRVISTVSVVDARNTTAWKIRKVLLLAKRAQSPEVTANNKMFEHNSIPPRVIWGIAAKKTVSIYKNFASTSLARSIIGKQDVEFHFATSSGQQKFRERFGLFGLEIFEQSKDELINWKYPTLTNLIEKLKENIDLSDSTGTAISDFPDVTEREVTSVMEFRKQILYSIGREEFVKHPKNILGYVSLLRVLRNNNFRIDIALEEVLRSIKLRDKYNLRDVNMRIWRKNMSFDELPGFDSHRRLAGDQGNFRLDRHGNLIRLAGVLRMVDIDYGNVQAVALACNVDPTYKDFPNVNFIIYMNEYNSILVDELSRKRKKMLDSINVFDISNAPCTSSMQISSAEFSLGYAGNMELPRRLHNSLKQMYTNKNVIYDVFWGEDYSLQTLKSSDVADQSMNQSCTHIYFENTDTGSQAFFERFGVKHTEIGISSSKAEKYEKLTELIERLGE